MFFWALSSLQESRELKYGPVSCMWLPMVSQSVGYMDPRYGSDVLLASHPQLWEVYSVIVSILASLEKSTWVEALGLKGVGSSDSLSVWLCSCLPLHTLARSLHEPRLKSVLV